MASPLILNLKTCLMMFNHMKHQPKHDVTICLKFISKELNRTIFYLQFFKKFLGVVNILIHDYKLFIFKTEASNFVHR